MIIRKARAADLPVLADIEREGMSSPWSKELIAAELFHPAALVLVAKMREQFPGFVVFRGHPPEAEILRLVVRPYWRRQGIARKILQVGFKRLVGQGIRVCFLEVRSSNFAARSCYDRAGFTEVGRRPGYYRQPVEDAVVMQLHMNELLEEA